MAHHVVEDGLPPPASTKVPEGEDVESYDLLKAIVLILVAMWAGSWLTIGFTSMGLTLPAYIGAMLVAAVIRNIDDVTGLFGLSQRTIDDVGNVALSIFLVMALMTLRLWELVGLALPLAIMLTAQLAAVGARGRLPRLAADAPRLRGRGHGERLHRVHAGHDGERDGQHEGAGRAVRTAPKAFLVVPMVGAFFIDFTNALIITAFLNYFSEISLARTRLQRRNRHHLGRDRRHARRAHSGLPGRGHDRERRGRLRNLRRFVGRLPDRRPYRR